MFGGAEGLIEGGAGTDHDEAAVGVIDAVFPLLDHGGDIEARPLAVGKCAGGSGGTDPGAYIIPRHVTPCPSGVAGQGVLRPGASGAGRWAYSSS